MKMGQIVVIEIHCNDNTVKTTDYRHQCSFFLQ